MVALSGDKVSFPLRPWSVLDFVDPDRVDLTEHPVLQPEGDDMFHGVEHLIP